LLKEIGTAEDAVLILGCWSHIFCVGNEISLIKDVSHTEKMRVKLLTFNNHTYMERRIITAPEKAA